MVVGGLLRVTSTRGVAKTLLIGAPGVLHFMGEGASNMESVYICSLMNFIEGTDGRGDKRLLLAPKLLLATPINFTTIQSV